MLSKSRNEQNLYGANVTEASLTEVDGNPSVAEVVVAITKVALYYSISFVFPEIHPKMKIEALENFAVYPVVFLFLSFFVFLLILPTFSFLYLYCCSAILPLFSFGRKSPCRSETWIEKWEAVRRKFKEMWRSFEVLQDKKNEIYICMEKKDWSASSSSRWFQFRLWRRSPPDVSRCSEEEAVLLLGSSINFRFVNIGGDRPSQISLSCCS